MNAPTVFARTVVAPFLAGAILASAPLAAGAETVRDERLGITVTLPEGFAPVPVESRPPEFPFCYARDFPRPDRSLSIAFRGCGVRVTDDEMTLDDIASLKRDHPGAEVTAERWRAAKLDVVRYTRADPDGVRRVYYGTSLPLRPEAVFLVVSGPEDGDAEVREQLRAVLRGFGGTPSSSAADGVTRKPGNRWGIKNGHVVLAALVLVAVGVLILVRRRKARSERPPLVVPVPHPPGEPPRRDRE